MHYTMKAYWVHTGKAPYFLNPHQHKEMNGQQLHTLAPSLPGKGPKVWKMVANQKIPAKNWTPATKPMAMLPCIANNKIQLIIYTLHNTIWNVRVEIMNSTCTWLYFASFWLWTLTNPWGWNIFYYSLTIWSISTVCEIKKNPVFLLCERHN
jgi:hypothetical protein